MEVGLEGGGGFLAGFRPKKVIRCKESMVVVAYQAFGC